MQHNLAIVMLALLLSGGCASYEASLAPIPKAGAMPAWVVEGPVAVGADPYVQEERQMAVFGGDLKKKGVLPIQVLVQNQGDRPVLIRGSDMRLVLAEGRQISSAGATTVAAKFDDTSGHTGEFFFFGPIITLAVVGAAAEAEADRRADFKSKKFSNVTLGKNESAHGFVYFVPPAGTPPFTEATLRVHCVDAESAKGLVVNLPVSGLEFEEQAEDDTADDY